MTAAVQRKPRKKSLRLRYHLQKRLLRMFDFLHAKKRTRVVMIHHGRCGSTVLARLLDDHPDVFWEGELFKAPRIQRHKREFGRFSFPETLTTYERFAKKKTFGFEMKFIHIDELGFSQEEFLHMMETMHYDHIILLTRKNLLRREVSSAVAKEIGQFHFKPGQEPRMHRITLDPVRTVKQLDKFRDHRKKMEALLKDKKHLALTYEEDIKNDPRVAYAKACTYLGLRSYPTSPRLKRSTPYALKDIILNYDEMKSVLKNTEYAWMLEEETPAST